MLQGYLPRDLLTSQMRPLPQGTELMGDFLHCPSSTSESEVNSNVPTVLRSHLKMTLQSINSVSKGSFGHKHQRAAGPPGWDDPAHGEADVRPSSW